MRHSMEFDPYLIGERNRQILGGVRAMRIEEWLRRHREGSGSRPVALILRLKSTFRQLRGWGVSSPSRATVMAKRRLVDLFGRKMIDSN